MEPTPIASMQTMMDLMQTLLSTREFILPMMARMRKTQLATKRAMKRATQAAYKAYILASQALDDPSSQIPVGGNPLQHLELYLHRLNDRIDTVAFHIRTDAMALIGPNMSWIDEELGASKKILLDLAKRNRLNTSNIERVIEYMRVFPVCVDPITQADIESLCGDTTAMLKCPFYHTAPSINLCANIDRLKWAASVRDAYRIAIAEIA
jgi:hypothetical protein